MKNTDPVKTLVIVGAGFMGKGVACAALSAGFDFYRKWRTYGLSIRPWFQ